MQTDGKKPETCIAVVSLQVRGKAQRVGLGDHRSANQNKGKEDGRLDSCPDPVCARVPACLHRCSQHTWKPEICLRCYVSGAMHLVF